MGVLSRTTKLGIGWWYKAPFICDGEEYRNLTLRRPRVIQCGESSRAEAGVFVAANAPQPPPLRARTTWLPRVRRDNASSCTISSPPSSSRRHRAHSSVLCALMPCAPSPPSGPSDAAARHTVEERSAGQSAARFVSNANRALMHSVQKAKGNGTGQRVRKGEENGVSRQRDEGPIERQARVGAARTWRRNTHPRTSVNVLCLLPVTPVSVFSLTSHLPNPPL